MDVLIPKVIAFATQHLVLVGAWVIVFFATIFVFIKEALSSVKEIDNQGLTFLVNKENAVVIDIRSLDEFNQGHIAGSYQFLPKDIKNRNIGKIEQYKERPVIVACANGFNARGIAQELYKQGFTHVYNLKEGITGWRVASLPLVRKH